MTSDLVGLYVHVPFCSLKCFYCDFAAVAHHGHLVDRYLRALEREAALKTPRVRRRLQGLFDTVYVGGGTPSELSAEQIGDLFRLLKRAYIGLNPAEITFECNPESTTPEKLEALAAAGVTRLSLGLQTADDELLRGIGRRHTAEDFLSVFQTARRLGLWDISVDLMYNLPGQSLRSCLDSLNFVLDLDPEHVSLYGLQVEDQTLFGKRGVTPDEDAGREMFEACLDGLAAAGYRHYEVSNFAKPGREAQHNLNYWRNGTYEGLGCGAARYIGGVRSVNIDRLVPYMEAVEAGRDPVEDSETLTGKARHGEDFMLGLRLVDGFKPVQPAEAAFTFELAALEDRGLLRRTPEGMYALTRDGLFLGNQVFREFVPPYKEAVHSNQ